MPDSDTAAGDAESSGGLVSAFKRIFAGTEGGRSLRAQLEEAIDEHEHGHDNDGGEETPEEKAKVASTPASLGAALKALETDNEFLLQGDVFSEDLISTWIAYKREHEVDPLRIRPQPYEFMMYYDV